MSTPYEKALEQIEYTEIPNPSVSDEIPYATHEGILNLGEIKIKVYILNNGQRVIDAADFFGETN